MFAGVRRNFALWLLLAAVCAPGALAQGTRVEGVVRDASGASVPGARVKLTAGSYSAETTTDTSGAFAFDGVAASSGTVVVTAKGFEQVRQEWTTAGAKAQISVELRPGVLTQQVMVTAARTPTPIGETPVSSIQLSCALSVNGACAHRACRRRRARRILTGEYWKAPRAARR